jgi:hypothetical protein
MFVGLILHALLCTLQMLPDKRHHYCSLAQPLIQVGITGVVGVANAQLPWVSAI